MVIIPLAFLGLTAVSAWYHLTVLSLLLGIITAGLYEVRSLLGRTHHRAIERNPHTGRRRGTVKW